MPIDKGRGGSGAFLALATDQRQWWIKPTNNAQSPKVPVTEYIVSGVGKLIGAPVCDTSIVRIPEELAGWVFTNDGLKLEPGLAHASLHVATVAESGELQYRENDDNRVRHAGVLAIYDWCYGTDDQWLYCESQDRKLYSHDHGHYFPSGPDWTESTLQTCLKQEHLPTCMKRGISGAELTRLAGALKKVTKKDLKDLLVGVPASWDVTDSELEVVGYFLEERASAVAERLERIASQQ